MQKLQITFYLTILVALFILMCQSVSAQPQCEPRDKVVERLNDIYGEAVQSRGLAKNGKVLVETWANTESGSWTVTVTNTEGETCMVAFGNMFANTA